MNFDLDFSLKHALHKLGYFRGL